ncbi:MAG: CsgG/HfaB family protein [candidate division KSB1 bacterium]|nr:CsgG/HfaB family protein [candidate division KSB1 bacterium]
MSLTMQWLWVVLFVLTTVSPVMARGSKSLKKRIAVFVFQDKTDKRFRWWDGRSVGDGVADMLTTALVKSGKYIVLERQEMDKLLQEQDLGTSGIVTPESAAKIGKMLGVELAVMGAVTEFGYSKSEVGGAIKGIGLGVKSQAATVAVDVRLVNTSTGEIVAAENVRKSKSKKGLRIRTDEWRFNSRNDFDQSLVGKAARDAINSVVKLIDKHAPKIRWQAKVVLAKSGMVVINAGASAGVKKGQRFVVFHPGEELIDPDTGLSLGSMETKSE